MKFYKFLKIKNVLRFLSEHIISMCFNDFIFIKIFMKILIKMEEIKLNKIK